MTLQQNIGSEGSYMWGRWLRLRSILLNLWGSANEQ
jgi:hypothetical protein